MKATESESAASETGRVSECDFCVKRGESEVRLVIMWHFLLRFLGGCIYDPGSRFPTLPKPNLCDCAHFFHMRAPTATTVTRMASQDARSV